MKSRLIKDIEADIMVCEMEGWEYNNYLEELKDIINNFMEQKNDSFKQI